ncbi:ribulose-phosphate 3-epimerase [Oceanobacillus aidingensis]|uniref:Ribulose-phosphate 3-epimerase n=1 Tax=Oceanobacillus aidingensis TaxID=645964 RepID=A0ABV9JSP5_9BACI
MYKVAASIMCANQMELKNELRQLENAEVDILHCDVMDGVYVNNLAMGPYVLEDIKKTTSIPLDIHLATKEPDRYIEMFAPVKPEYMSFHIEAADNVQKNIQKLRDYGIKPALALNPETPVERIFPYLDDLEMVLMMTVNPGFAGQKFNYSVLEKLEILSKRLEKKARRPLIEVDGNINEETIPLLVERGANVYVLGTSQLFNQQPESYRSKVNNVQTLLKGE